MLIFFRRKFAIFPVEYVRHDYDFDDNDYDADYNDENQNMIQFQQPILVVVFFLNLDLKWINVLSLIVFTTKNAPKCAFLRLCSFINDFKFLMFSFPMVKLVEYTLYK